MRKIAMILVVVIFVFTGIANAEIVVKEQLDGSFLVKEQTEKVIGFLPILPTGVNLDPKNPEDAKAMIHLWDKSLFGVIVAGKSETRILKLFPITIKKVTTGEKKLGLVDGKWNVYNLPSEVEPTNNGYTVLLILGLIIVFTSIVVVSSFNRWHGKSIMLLLFYYALVLTISAVGINKIIAYTTVFAVLSFGSILGAAIVIGSTINYAASFRIFIVSAIAMCSVVVGSLINIFLAAAISFSGNKGAWKEYFLFVLVSEVVAFIIAKMVKNIHDKQKRQIGVRTDGMTPDF